MPTPTRAQLALLVIVVAQAAWLGAICARGWFYEDDLNYLFQGSRRPPGWGYLTSPINAHLTPGLRLVFWLFAHTSHLGYGATVVERVVAQAVGTVLLYQLLRLVSRSQFVVLVVTALYAFSPMLVPATQELAAVVNTAPAQIGALLALYGCARQAGGGRLRWAVLAGFGLLVAACFWEKTAVDAVVVLVLFRIGWLTDGPFRERVRATLHQWRAWLLILGPVAAFGIYFVAKGYGEGSNSLSASAAVHVVWDQWTKALWPAVLGGPWHWSAIFPGLYVDYAVPTTTAIVLGQIAFVGLVIAACRRTGWSGLLVWTMPIAAVVVGEVLVAVGRYQFYRGLIAVDFRYVYDVLVPLALAVVIGLAPGGLVKVSTRAAPPPTELRRRIGLAAVAVAGCAVIVSSLVSGERWTNGFEASPSKAYVQAAMRSVQRAGPSVSFYDTADPQQVVNVLEPDRYLSDLVVDAGRSASFDQASRPLEMINHFGQAVPAAFAIRAHGGSRLPGSDCVARLSGARGVTLRFDKDLAPGDYFLRLEYSQQQPDAVTLKVKGHGVFIPTRDGSTMQLGATSGESITGLGLGGPAQVTIASASADTDICLRSVDVGVPVAASR